MRAGSSAECHRMLDELKCSLQLLASHHLNHLASIWLFLLTRPNLFVPALSPRPVAEIFEGSALGGHAFVDHGAHQIVTEICSTHQHGGIGAQDTCKRTDAHFRCMVVKGKPAFNDRQPVTLIRMSTVFYGTGCNGESGQSPKGRVTDSLPEPIFFPLLLDSIWLPARKKLWPF